MIKQQENVNEIGAGSFGFGRWFDDFTVGQTFRHPVEKTIFESDNNLFSLLTMNHHPVHTSLVHAANSHHGKILVVGTLVFSLAVGITVPDVSGKAIANLGYGSVEHCAPCFINDTIRVVSQVISKNESKTKSDRGMVTLISNVYNQNDIVICRFERTILVQKSK